MSAVALLFLLFILSKHGGNAGAAAASLPAAAAAAQTEARIKTDKANASGSPVHAAEAKAAQTKAAVLTQHARRHAAAKKQAPPWPQATPNGLPPFPAGWVPDEPPAKVVQNRAWQLLPQLWKQGANARKTEQTAGRWITYVAQAMGAKKGVVAYKVRPGAMPTPTPSTDPQANA